MKNAEIITLRAPNCVGESPIKPFFISMKELPQIIEQPYMDNVKNVYGMLYEIDGNVASQSQFYVTDSLHHFVTGSVYFFAKPNYDSILPAANYLKKDIQHIMETITWNSD